MKIINVKIKNFKCIEDLEANIEGKSIMLVGKNGRGKSSFLQAVNLALGLDKVFPHNAITKGKNEGEIRVMTGSDGNKYEFSVKLREGKDPVVSLRTSEGIKTTEKGVIANIVGSVPFDVFEFIELSRTKPGKRKQVDIIKSFLPKETTYQLDQHKARIENKIEVRKQIKRDITTYEGFINSSGMMESDLPKYAERINLSELQDKHGMITGVIQRNEQRKVSNFDLEVSIKDLDRQIESLKERQDKYRQKITENNKLNLDAEKWLSENKNPEELQKEIKEASEHNVKCAKAQELSTKIKRLRELEEELENVDILIKTSSSEIEEFVKTSPLPIPGLTFTDDAIFYNGIEVDEANLATSEIILLGARLKMARNPTAKILTIERCESLDEDKIKELLEFAKKYDFQLLLESVEKTKEELEILILPDYETIPQS